MHPRHLPHGGPALMIEEPALGFRPALGGSRAIRLRPRGLGLEIDGAIDGRR